MMPQQAKPFDWRTAIKSWDAASAQRKAQQPKKTQNMEMILALGNQDLKNPGWEDYSNILTH